MIAAKQATLDKYRRVRRMRKSAGDSTISPRPLAGYHQKARMHRLEVYGDARRGVGVAGFIVVGSAVEEASTCTKPMRVSLAIAMEVVIATESAEVSLPHCPKITSWSLVTSIVSEFHVPNLRAKGLFEGQV